MPTQYVYLNGRILPAEEAAISPFDIGLLRGYAVFDLLRTSGGRPFLLAEHLDRFRCSAAELDLTVPVDDSKLTGAIDELLALNGHAEATVRLVLTGGVSSDGMSYDSGSPTLFILTHELHEPPASLYERGGKLVTKNHQREFPYAKTTAYLTMVRNKPLVDAAGALDLLYHDDGLILEPATASFYLVQGTRILAPRNRVLRGTTGELVLRMASQKYEVVVGDMWLDDAFAADEAFLTSTTRGVAPIVLLDDRPIGDGAVGPVTKDLIRMFREALENA
jgi:branched-chain amino acid aminotransferase